MSPILLAALISVESSGNDLAKGDHGKALGPLQIHKTLVQDVNRIHKTRFEWQRMTNRSEAVAVFTLYVQTYAPNGSDEDIARLWNSGPAYQQKRRATDLYWRKVRNAMNRLSHSNSFASK